MNFGIKYPDLVESKVLSYSEITEFYDGNNQFSQMQPVPLQLCSGYTLGNTELELLPLWHSTRVRDFKNSSLISRRGAAWKWQCMRRFWGWGGGLCFSSWCDVQAHPDFRVSDNMVASEKAQGTCPGKPHRHVIQQAESESRRIKLESQMDLGRRGSPCWGEELELQQAGSYVGL